MPAVTTRAAPIMTRKPSAMPSRPSANFTGVEGSMLRRASATQRAENPGAKTTMKIALSDWNQPAGTVNSPKTRSV